MAGGKLKYMLAVTSADADSSFVERLAAVAAARGPARVHVPLPGQPAKVAAVVELSDAASPDLAEWAAGLDVGEEAVSCYRVSEELRWSRPGVDLPANGGVSFICFVRRVPTLDSAQFEQHWTQMHRPLAIEHHTGMLEYVQNVVREQLTPSEGPAVDGIAELVFATGDHIDKDLFPSEESRRVIRDDVARFVGSTQDGLYRLLPC